MDNLWKKETPETGATYVDLLAFIPRDKWDVREVIEVSKCLESYHSTKDNKKAAEFRMQGNDEFRMKHWSNAMQLYNQCLCFAEIGTEEVALAYANRSACFFYMEKYNEALVDIEFAEKVNAPDRLMARLEHRKQESQRMMVEVAESPKNRVSKLSYAPNKKFPCLADVVDIKQNNEFGRHLVATQDIPVGKVVLFEEDFIAIRMGNDLVCETCHRQNANFIACDKCSDVLFCSTECKEQNLIHKWECGSLPKSMQNDNLTEYYDRLKFQIRLVFLAVEIFGSVESLMEFVKNALNEDPEVLPKSLNDSQSQYHFFFKLMAPIAPDGYSAVCGMLCKGVNNLPKINTLFDFIEKQRFLMHLVAHHFLLTYINSIGNKLTKSLANVLSMLNHSCDANLRVVYSGKHQCCITIRPIKKGDQFFICYLENDVDPLEKRQQMLKEKWDFVCKCIRCHPPAETREYEYEPIDSDPSYGFVLSNYPDAEKSTQVFERCIQLLNKYGKYPWSLGFSIVADIYASMLDDQTY